MTYTFITVANWQYSLSKENGRIRIFHGITKDDYGYATHVDTSVSADYFETHSVEDFYNFVVPMEPAYWSISKEQKEAELKQLEKKLLEAGFLSNAPQKAE